GNTMTVDTCAFASYDTALEVFCGGCTTPVCAGGNDDFCGMGSSVTFCSAAGQTFLVLVHGHDGDSGNFELTLSDDGVPCTTPPICTPCADCPPDASREREPCGGDTNGGCNSVPTAYEPVPCS